MPSGGTITIGTSNVRLGAPERPEGPPPGDYVMCFVADAGTGIPNEMLDKVFEPFFTTKKVGKGSGLGLSQVLGVAKQLARISQRGRCIGAPDLGKSFCESGLSQGQGEPDADRV